MQGARHIDRIRLDRGRQTPRAFKLIGRLIRQDDPDSLSRTVGESQRTDFHCLPFIESPRRVGQEAHLLLESGTGIADGEV